MDDVLKTALNKLCEHLPERQHKKYLANLLGVTPSAVHHWYNDQNGPRPHTLKRIEKLTKTDLSHLTHLVVYEEMPAGENLSPEILAMIKMLKSLPTNSQRAMLRLMPMICSLSVDQLEALTAFIIKFKN